MSRRTPTTLAALLLTASLASAALAQDADFTPLPSSPAFEEGTLEAANADARPAALAPPTTQAADPNRLLRAPLSEVGRQALRGGEVRWSVLVAAAGLLITLAVAVSLHRRLTGDPNDPATGQAFLAYARSLGLNWQQTLLLVRIARAAKLPTPLTLLVASGTLYHHGRQFAAGFSMARRERIHRTLSAIHRQAFPHTLRYPHKPAFPEP